MVKKILFLFFVFSSIHQIVAQHKTYSQKDVDTLFDTDPNRKTLPKLKHILETNTNLVGWMPYYKQKTYYHLVDKERDSVIFYANKGILYLQERNKNGDLRKDEDKYLKGILAYLGIIYFQESNYKKSLDYMLKAKQQIHKYPNFHRRINAYINGYISHNFLEMGDKKEAYKYRLEVLKDSLHMSSPKSASVTYHQLAILNDILGKKDSVIYFYRKSIKNREEINDIAGIRASYGNIGEFYLDENNKDSALYYFKKSMQLLDKYPDENYGLSKYFTRTNYSKVLIEEEDLENAVQILKNTLDSIAKIKKIDENTKELKSNTFKYLIEAYIKKGQFDNALKFSQQHIKLLENYHQQVLDEKLRELNIAYQVNEKEQLIEKLEKTTNEQKTIIKQRTVIAVFSGITILAFIGFGILLFRQRRLKNKYKLVNLEQRLLRSQLNPHFLFNALNTVSSLAHKKSEKTNLYVNRLSNLIRLILKNSREEFVSLNDELKVINDYLELQSNFSKKFSFNIQSSPKTDEVYIPPMFIQPIVENSIQHGINGIQNGHIDLRFRVDLIRKLLIFEITDNGMNCINELDPNSSSFFKEESFSLKILNERLVIYKKTMNKEVGLTIKNINLDVPTLVEIKLPFVVDM
ncbi:histidine kinase [Aquimarina sp. D1M17]|uniref:tetratricopeptide repeat-containing sensor histidine kinase n=1 Tax=Aquimarina acroporae TaxID=2937283 RepID=UPI0020BEE536|nr:histidine kinase [Aquimarina acroporae]MCK8524393.1 histidine kinase [Aquimarina acroporae]